MLGSSISPRRIQYGQHHRLMWWYTIHPGCTDSFQPRVPTQPPNPKRLHADQHRPGTNHRLSKDARPGRPPPSVYPCALLHRWEACSGVRRDGQAPMSAQESRDMRQPGGYVLFADRCQRGFRLADNILWGKEVARRGNFLFPRLLMQLLFLCLHRRPFSSVKPWTHTVNLLPYRRSSYISSCKLKTLRQQNEMAPMLCSWLWWYVDSIRSLLGD